MEQRSEPTTDEIIGVLKYKAGLANGCVVAYVSPIYLLITASRLESQQRDLLQLTAERDAEKARADAAVADILDILSNHGWWCHYCTKKNCNGCTNATAKGHFEWRGEKGKATE